MRTCNHCNRHIKTELCPFCQRRSPRVNAAALMIGASFIGAGPVFDRIFSCNEQTVVAPYGAPQPPPDAAPIVTPLPDAGKGD